MKERDANNEAAPPPLTGRHLWEFQPVRDLVWMGLAIVALLAVYWLRAWVAPIVIAFALAYVVQPVVRVARERLGVPASVSAVLCVLVLAASLAGFGLWLWPQFVSQAEALGERLPEYVDVLAQKARTATLTTQPASQVAHASTQPALNGWLRNIGPPTDAEQVSAAVARFFGVVGNIVGIGAYAFTALLLVLILFVYFTGRFDHLENLKQWLPASRRERHWELLGNVGRAFGAYVRGQIIVAAFTTTGFLIGFWLASVPYWFVVSLVGGVLSLVPYGQMSGWLLAIVLKYVETQTGDATFSWFGILVAPSLVYAVTQSAETWVVTPLVQGDALHMHPVVIIIVLIFGAAIAGVVGLILAIPVAASLKMLMQEEVWPRYRRWTEVH